MIPGVISTSSPNMTLLDILSCYPILEALLSALPLGALLNLSKVNSEFRAILHNFGCRPLNHRDSKSRKDRLDLNIGRHQTSSWLHCKSLCLLECSEPHHTKGQNVRGCRMCSMPVCEACIVKSSFGKKENTFQARRRYMCKDCWISGNARTGLIRAPDSAILNYDRSELCHCTAKDGTLCLRCKEHQNSEAEQKHAYCAGNGCSNEVNDNNSGGRICLWCSSVIPGPRSMEESYKIYNSRDLFPSRSPEEVPAADMQPRPRHYRFEDQKWDAKLKVPTMKDDKKDLVSAPHAMKKLIPTSSSLEKEVLPKPILPVFPWEQNSSLVTGEGSSVSQETSSENRSNIPDVGNDQCPKYESRQDMPRNWRDAIDEDEATLRDPERDEIPDEDEITLREHE